MEENNSNSHLQSSSQEISILPDGKHFLMTAEFYVIITFGEKLGQSLILICVYIYNYELFYLNEQLRLLKSLQWDHSTIRSRLLTNAVQQHS